MKPEDARWFSSSLGSGRRDAPAPAEEALTKAERKRAGLIARIAGRLLSGWMANGRNIGSAEQNLRPMVRLATQIEAEAARVVAAPEAVAAAPAMQTPSPQATAWQAGYRDGEAGRPPSYRGPAELHADYWDGMNVALADERRRAAND
jgi:hypothetical protein